MGILGFEIVNHEGYDLMVVDDGLNCTDCSLKLHEALDHFGDNTPLWFFRTDSEKHGYELTIVSDEYITDEALRVCLEKWASYASLITSKSKSLKTTAKRIR